MESVAERSRCLPRSFCFNAMRSTPIAPASAVAPLARFSPVRHPSAAAPWADDTQIAPERRADNIVRALDLR